MYKLKTHDNYGNKIYAPENAPIINIQCKDPVIDLLENFVNEDNDRTVSDLINLIKQDIDYNNTRFLIDDCKALFEAVGID